MITRYQMAQVRATAETQSRTSIDMARVEEYAELLRDGIDLIPIEGVLDGEIVWVWDGFHRRAAHEAVGHTEIDVHTCTGTKRDAVLLSTGANATHGVRRSKADIQRAVTVLLRDDEWGGRSDSWVAQQARVADKTVARVRASLEAKSEVPIRDTRTGQDGVERPARRPRLESSEPKPARNDGPADPGPAPVLPPAIVPKRKQPSYSSGSVRDTVKPVLETIRRLREQLSDTDWDLFTADMEALVVGRNFGGVRS